MKRDLDALATTSFDLAVIGGGVIGVATARDAARRGLKVALLERDDFASAASEAMSHLIHGGIRYLAQGHLRQVSRSLSERAIWRRIAPDHVAPLHFLMPLIGKSARSRWALAAGTRLFEALGGNGFGRLLSPAEAIAAEPALDLPGLQGALRYSDCRLERPEYLVLAMLADGAGHGMVAANHAEAAALDKDDRVWRLTVRDHVGGASFRLRALAVANISGPWAAQLATRLVPGQRAARLVASKGIHLVTRAVTSSHAIALSGNGEHGFVAPFGSFSLVGTSDVPVSGDFSRPVASPGDIAELTARLTRLLPSLQPALEHPLAAFAGIRALPGEGGDTYSAVRDFRIADHAGDGAAGFYSVYGGKWTTARFVAEAAVDRIARYLGRRLRPCDTRSAPIPALPEAQLAALLAVTPEDRERRRSRLSVLESRFGSQADRRQV
jgi:glycerol-3-phosphate dehydrogenase